MRNTSHEVLEYICFSTMIAPEVAEYPDSGKIGVIAGSAPGGDKARRSLFLFYKKDRDVDYYEGE
jgi:uncharacterized cupin superfamily protein